MSDYRIADHTRPLVEDGPLEALERLADAIEEHARSAATAADTPAWRAFALNGRETAEEMRKHILAQALRETELLAAIAGQTRDVVAILTAVHMTLQKILPPEGPEGDFILEHVSVLAKLGRDTAMVDCDALIEASKATAQRHIRLWHKHQPLSRSRSGHASEQVTA